MRGIGGDNDRSHLPAGVGGKPVAALVHIHGESYVIAVAGYVDVSYIERAHASGRRATGKSDGRCGKGRENLLLHFSGVLEQIYNTDSRLGGAEIIMGHILCRLCAA